jgi:hypothetical protein
MGYPRRRARPSSIYEQMEAKPGVIKTLEEFTASGVHKVLTKHYDSMGELLRELENRPSFRGGRFGEVYNGANWHGARDWKHGMQIIREGIPNFQKEISSLVDKVSVNLPSTQDMWVADIAGACPIVPMAIAGLPDNMLRLEQQETSGVPLRIFVSTAYSGGCETSMIERRGVAILALLESLAAKRPVELLLFAEFDDANYNGFHTPIVRVDSMPLDQTTLTAALVSPVVSRLMFMGWADSNPEGFGGAWAWGSLPPNDPQSRALTREALGAAKGDLVISAAFLTESDLILRDPLAWVTQQVALTEAHVNE